MTAIVGIICKKGVVVGADSSATFNAGQINTMEQKTKKIQIIDNKIIIAGTGSIGLGQRFFHEVEIQEHTNNIKDLESHISKFKDGKDEKKEVAVEIPKPEGG